MKPGSQAPAFEPRTWAEVDLDAVRANARAVRAIVGPAPELLAVVKANAYGHGVEAVAEALRDLVGYFGVACIEEASRVEGLGPRVLLLSPCLASERPLAVARGHIATVSSAAEARAFAACGPCTLNLKIDTGMGRIGCNEAAAAGELDAIARLPGVTVHSISTHLPSADEDHDFTRSQLARFHALRATLAPLAPHAKFHVLNSAGAFGFPAHACDIVRAGLALYGSACPPFFQQSLLPALTWKARVLLVRDLPAGWGVSYGRTHITRQPVRTAVVSAGYADGYPRQASGRGAEVLIRGIRRPILGRITMDQLIVEAGPDLDEGDEVVLLGRQGSEEITARELAVRANTIAWHIFTGLSPRVARRFSAIHRT